MAFEIDKTDFLLLKCLQEAGQPLWKKQLHERQVNLFENMISIQTVGRRVDRLHDEGLLSSCIVSPEDINRDLIIAFKLTEKGQQALGHKRRAILMNAIKPTLFNETTKERPITKEELTDFMCTELQLDKTVQQTLQEYSWDELTALLTLHLVKTRMEDVFRDVDPDRFAEIIEKSPELEDVFFSTLADEITS